MVSFEFAQLSRLHLLSLMSFYTSTYMHTLFIPYNIGTIITYKITLTIRTCIMNVSKYMRFFQSVCLQPSTRLCVGREHVFTLANRHVFSVPFASFITDKHIVHFIMLQYLYFKFLYLFICLLILLTRSYTS